MTTLLKIRSDKLIIVNLSRFTITRRCKSSDNNSKKQQFSTEKKFVGHSPNGQSNGKSLLAGGDM